ncbi:gastrula zinc finger protein XlCGF26.1-like [Cylas formicarius]|uniref:gastrula zinc finger protein XlCGF26.1-like n=1 Tax=Cylas formicarius TaxID=197179 RepID=UPI002958AACC|nr:gastrula zinc finger protein XlCGF26.1-like [Cylas formicarius]
MSGCFFADVFYCKKCDKVYTKQQSLYVHTKYDCGNKRQWRCLFRDCRHRTTRTGNMKRHISGMHGSRLKDLLRNVNFKDHVCPACNRQFKRKDHVQRHYLELHLCRQTQFGFKCASCGRGFKRKYLMENHEKICGIKPEKPRLPCFKCGIEFRTKASWVSHMEALHGLCAGQL